MQKLQLFVFLKLHLNIKNHVQKQDTLYMYN